MLIELYVRELHINMPKKDDTGFSMKYDEKVLVRISDSAIQLILLP